MKTKIRPPRKKQSWDITNIAQQALKDAGQPLPLNDLKTAIEIIIENKHTVSLSSLHTELNLDGRFIFLNDNRWALKSQVPHLRRRAYDDFDILEEEYQPIRDDYNWDSDSDDEDDESDLLIPFEEEDDDFEEDEIEDEPEKADLDEIEDDEEEEEEDSDDFPPTKSQ